MGVLQVLYVSKVSVIKELECLSNPWCNTYYFHRGILLEHNLKLQLQLLISGCAQIEEQPSLKIQVQSSSSFANTLRQICHNRIFTHLYCQVNVQSNRKDGYRPPQPQNRHHLPLPGHGMKISLCLADTSRA